MMKTVSKSTKNDHVQRAMGQQLLGDVHFVNKALRVVMKGNSVCGFDKCLRFSLIDSSAMGEHLNQ